MRVSLLIVAILTFSINCFPQTKQLNYLVGNAIGVSTFGEDDWAIGLIKSGVQSIPMFDSNGNQTVIVFSGQMGYVTNQSGNFYFYQFEDTCHSLEDCIKLVQKTSIDGNILKEFNKLGFMALPDEKLIKLSGGTVLMEENKGFYVGEDSSEYTIHLLTRNNYHFTSFNANWFSDESSEGFKPLHKEDYIANRSTISYRTFLKMLQILQSNFKE